MPGVLGRIRQEVSDAAQRSALIGLVEEVIVSKLPQLSREEVAAMFQLGDYRKSRIFQDGKEEGKLEGELIGKLEGEQRGILETKMALIPKLHADGYATAEIAELLDVPVRDVQKLLRSSRTKKT